MCCYIWAVSPTRRTHLSSAKSVSTSGTCCRWHTTIFIVPANFLLLVQHEVLGISLYKSSLFTWIYHTTSCQQLFDSSLPLHYWKCMKHLKSHRSSILFFTASGYLLYLKYGYCHSWTFSCGIIYCMVGYEDILLDWIQFAQERFWEESWNGCYNWNEAHLIIPGEEHSRFHNRQGLCSGYFLHPRTARFSWVGLQLYRWRFACRSLRSNLSWNRCVTETLWGSWKSNISSCTVDDLIK